MDSLDNLALYNILLQSEPKDIKSLCRTSKKISKLCSNDIIFKNLLEAHFPKTVKRKNTYKEQYFHMVNILTEDNFNSIKSKPDVANESGFRIDDILDIYDLLYSTGGDHDWGVINLSPLTEEIPFIFKEFYSLYFTMDEVFSYYREREIGRTRYFLNDVRDGKITIDEEDWNVIVSEEENRGEENISHIYKNKENYTKSLHTLEERLQNETKSLPSDVKEQIKKYQSNIGDEDNKDALYNEQEIEFLQILYDAVQNDIIGIFEPFDFYILINKLRVSQSGNLRRKI
jgi:hypothetical protein